MTSQTQLNQDHATTTTNHATEKIGVLLTPPVDTVGNSTSFGLNQLPLLPEHGAHGAHGALRLIAS